MEAQLDDRRVQKVSRGASRRWLHALTLAGILSVLSGCTDSLSAPTQISPSTSTPRRYAPGECVDERDPCPEPAPTVEGSGGSGEAAPVDASNPSAGFWPESVFIVYTSPYDGAVMSGFANYVYSGATTATYVFGADSYTNNTHEVGGFTMDLGDRTLLYIEGQFTTESWHVSTHSAGH
jgi:hypothetical protein